MNQKKIGLALGSGSARGWAHIGIIEALKEHDIKIDYLAGTSIGAFVGAFYATGEFDYLKQFALGLDWKEVVSFFDVRFPTKGFLDGGRINQLISKQMENQLIEKTEIPFAVVSTNLNTGKELVLKKGKIVDAVRASISIPGVFTPFRKRKELLVDGGLVNPVPVNIVKEMGADIVIAVDLNHDLFEKKEERRKLKAPEKSQIQSLDEESNQVQAIKLLKEKYKILEESVSQKLNEWMPGNDDPNIFEIIANSINIMEGKITEINLQLNKPDILLQPPLGKLGLFDFDHAEESIEIGYKSMSEKIDPLKDLLKD